MNFNFVSIISKVIQVVKKIVNRFTISDQQAFTNRMLFLNKQCKIDFSQFVSVINKMPLYFLSQW